MQEEFKRCDCSTCQYDPESACAMDCDTSDPDHMCEGCYLEYQAALDRDFEERQAFGYC